MYSSLVESCEGSLFYCLGEILTNFWNESEKCWVVTDSRELYELLEKLCSQFFERLLLLKATKGGSRFEEPLEAQELLGFSAKSAPNDTLQKIVAVYFELLKSSSLSEEIELSEIIRKAMGVGDWHQEAFLTFIGKLFLYMAGEGSLELSEEYHLFTLSLIMRLEQKPENTNAYLEWLLDSEKYMESHYYFVWNQLKMLSFRKLAAFDEKTVQLSEQLYRMAYEGYFSQLHEDFGRVSKEEREINRVLVLTIQYLGERHAPTKTVKERCQALRRMGKEVCLVNTAEQYTGVGYVPMYASLIGSVEEEYDGISEIEIEGEAYPFCQLPALASMEDKFKIVQKIIRDFKPYYILSIGSGSMLADLVGNIVPCVSMALVFSTFPHAVNAIRILGRQMTIEEKKVYQRDDIIESRFTFQLNPQKRTYTRKELHLPEDKFILVVIGIRLTYEVTGELLAMFDRLCGQECFVLFAGYMDNYFTVMKDYPTLKGNSMYVGYCDDILALMEVCDLYVNPKRLGGGFSIIEAFEKGRPGVYLAEGDVYAAGGPDFAVADFQEMEETILRYKNDKEYYQHMAQLARERAQRMTASVEAMQEMDEKICRVIEEKY